MMIQNRFPLMLCWNFHSSLVSYKNKSKLNYLPPAAFRQFPFTKMFSIFVQELLTFLLLLLLFQVLVLLLLQLLNIKQVLIIIYAILLIKVKVKRICSNLLLKRKIRIFFEENTHKRKYGA